MTSESTFKKCPKILFHAHPDLDVLDLVGPFEVFAHARYGSYDEPPVFERTITAATPTVASNQDFTITSHIPLEEAYAKLADYDILLIPGGGSHDVLKLHTEPFALIKAFAALPKREDGGIRTLMTVCTGSIIAAETGILANKTSVTHPLEMSRLIEIVEKQGGKVLPEATFVVNPVDEEKQFRVVTAGGVSTGIDAALWMVEQVCGKAAKEQVAYIVQHDIREGVIV
ncbi:class I glutamine amidotransferase-like protein [Amylocarpus encephaloides]|uniref:Class I glutamine amidotransferase-like protein n=1 Tax=Amylocarpus encephaloides TaxID=45428 RepID=A0A9P8C2J8_9HELO|nr:class I glutamine amidotransferase-like protein [Amylocarpus encephaloides]